MSQSHAPVVSAMFPKLDADWIEQRIIRACVQLAVEASHGNEPCSVPLAQIGSLEICLTELFWSRTDGLPSFWLELRSRSGEVIDSLGCSEFDEDEFAAISDFIRDAVQRWQTLH